jgi:hypothetical protein
MLPAKASAYCRETTCDPSGARCDPPQENDCGVPLSWERTCIGFATDAAGSAFIPAATARAVLGQAFATWEAADCGSGKIGVHVEDMGYVNCGATEYNDHAGNANVLAFRDREWPHPEGIDNIALTTVTYDVKTGVIFDADIEVNTAQYQITVDDKTVRYDLLSVLTHEAGHFLGLAHSADQMATMFANYTEGDLGDRSIDPDDVTGICVVFPPATVKDTCNPIPRHGFATQCSSDQPKVGCTVSDRPARDDGAPLSVSALLLAACAAGLRARSGNRGSRRSLKC